MLNTTLRNISDAETEVMMAELSAEIDSDIKALLPRLNAEVAEAIADFAAETPTIIEDGDIFHVGPDGTIDWTPINR